MEFNCDIIKLKVYWLKWSVLNIHDFAFIVWPIEMDMYGWHTMLFDYYNCFVANEFFSVISKLIEYFNEGLCKLHSNQIDTEHSWNSII